MFPMKLHKSPKNCSNHEVSRLMAAAVVNKGFRNLLLSNPSVAMTSGYLGEKFAFNSEEMEQIGSIQAENLADFALQLVGGHYTEPTEISLAALM